MTKVSLVTKRIRKLITMKIAIGLLGLIAQGSRRNIYTRVKFVKDYCV